MAQYCDNFTFQDNDNDSFEFWNGLRGPAGPAGAPGAPGTSVELRGPVASTSELPASAPSSELWMVGEESPYDGYFWNGTAWIKAGYIMQGPQGEPGEDGADGVTFTPTVSSAGVISWTNDGGLPNPESVNIKGPAGQDGTNGQDGAPGAAAGFGVPTATVDGNVGTPSVTVTASGPDTAKVFSFAFSNLKGETGETGQGVPSGGTQGQVLAKKSSTDYDTEWVNGSGGGGGILYGECSTAASTVDKAVSITGFTSRAVGVCVRVKFTNANTASSPTLTINNDSSTSGFIVTAGYSTGTGAVSGEWAANQILDLVYDGYYWVIVDGVHASTSVYGKTMISDATPVMDGTAAAGSTGKVSDAGHVHPKDTSKQDAIAAVGMLKGAGSGSVSAATKGTDYGALAFTVTLDDASWSNDAQTVSNANFLASGYGYIVTPASASFADYAAAAIYADNVTTDGSMTFHCSTAPSSDLTVNILRVVSA